MDLPTIHLVLRATARVSFVLFISAFAAPALHVVWESRVSDLLRRYRDHFMVLFAASHTIHLAFVVMLALTMGWPVFLAQFTWATVIFGGLAFVLIYFLAIAAAARLLWSTPKRAFGGRFSAFAQYYIWTIFTLAYVPRVGPSHPGYSLLAAVALSAWVVRLAARRRAKAAALGTAA